MENTGKLFDISQEYYAYWLATAEGIGNRTRKELTEHAGSPKDVYEMDEKELRKLIPEAKVRKIVEAKREKVELEKQYQMLVNKRIAFFSIFHPDYPKRLKNIPNAPYGIFVEGGLPENEKPAVAVIGARQCSEYGRYVADICGRQLAEAGVNVISGLAKGIDGISQRAALQAGGKSYSVLGCGTNVCYPAENRSIYEAVRKNGGLISEYPPDTPPKAGLFPMRNRIISGLADIILIIEARNKSGTLITADLALEQGREVYVIPGRVTDSLSEGCNQLLKQGAGIVTSIADMLEETGLKSRLHRAGDRSVEEEEIEEKDMMDNKETYKSSKETKNGKEESCFGSKILRSLDFYPKSVETLQKETGLEYRQVVYEMMKLCMDGKARQVSAGQYIHNAKKTKNCNKTYEY